MSGLELEQRTNIKFLDKVGKSESEIREMLVQVYGDDAVKKTAVCKWVDAFANFIVRPRELKPIWMCVELFDVIT
jgi:hypothetical protein